MPHAPCMRSASEEHKYIKYNNDNKKETTQIFHEESRIKNNPRSSDVLQYTIYNTQRKF